MFRVEVGCNFFCCFLGPTQLEVAGLGERRGAREARAGTAEASTVFRL